MLHDLVNQLNNAFVTYQTPLSFLAGVGTHHLYCKYMRDREDEDVQEEG